MYSEDTSLDSISYEKHNIVNSDTSTPKRNIMNEDEDEVNEIEDEVNEMVKLFEEINEMGKTVKTSIKTEECIHFQMIDLPSKNYQDKENLQHKIVNSDTSTPKRNIINEYERNKRNEIEDAMAFCENDLPDMGDPTANADIIGYCKSMYFADESTI